MKRAYFFFLCLLYAARIIGQQPGTLLVSGEAISLTGCMANLNDTHAWKKTGLCTAYIVAPGVKLKDLTCWPHVSLGDTVIDFTYSHTKNVTSKPPADKEGTFYLTPDLVAIGESGCMQVNNQGNEYVLGKCGFNVVLRDLEIANLSCTSKVSGGNTTVTLIYPAVQ